MLKRIVVLAVIAVLMMSACTPAATQAPAAPATQAPAPEATKAPAAEPTKAPAPAASGVKELKIIWAEWDPANYLAELVKDYEKETGVKVTIIQEPWGSYYTRVSADWAAKGCGFEMLVGDSQWTGQGATQGHYVDLTDFLKTTGLADSVTPGTLKFYGEFPPNSGKYWGFPTEGDADGWAYRKDMFEDPKEKEAFKAKYGYDLAVPKTWKELLDISQFFYRPNATPPIYGAAIYTQKDYDAITMGFENVMFSYGVDWQDKDYNVMGVVNSPNAVKALEFYKELYKSGPPGNTNSFYAEMNNYFTSGQVVMAMNYFAFFPALGNEKTNPYAKVTGYFANPAGPEGARFAALGGQGLNVNAHCGKEQQQASLDFIKWFGQEKVQAKWASLGGYTCNKNVLASPDFLKVAPFNAAFAETMNMVKDFWNIPEYGELLTPAQTYLSGFVVGDQGTAQEAMDNIAKEQDKVLKAAGYIK